MLSYAQRPKPVYPRLYRRTRVWETLDCIPAPDDVHERYAGDLAHTPPQLAIASRDDEALVRRHALHEAVICICAGVRARKPLEARVSRDAG